MLIQFLIGVNAGCFICMYAVSPMLVGLTVLSGIFEYSIPSPYSYLAVTYLFTMVGVYYLITEWLAATKEFLPAVERRKDPTEEIAEIDEMAAAAAAAEDDAAEDDAAAAEDDAAEDAAAAAEDDAAEDDAAEDDAAEDAAADTIETPTDAATLNDQLNSEPIALLPPSPTDTEPEDEYADMPELINTDGTFLETDVYTDMERLIQANGTVLAKEEIADMPPLEEYTSFYQ